MHKSIFAGIALVLTSAAYGQMTLPLGYVNKDGGHYSQYIGYWPDAHIQILTGSLQGSNKATPWRRLALRRSQNTGGTNTARSWTNVQLAIGDMDYGKLSDTYTRNFVGTPTTVFSNKVSWPGFTGAPKNKPATWGHFVTKDDVLFPFTVVYVNKGVWGTCFDFRFRGGTTAASTYYSDGIASNNQTASGSTFATPTGSCTSGYFVTWLLCDKLAGGKAQHRMQPYTFNGLANANYFGLLGIENGSQTGKPFPGSCHPLHLDLTKPFVPYPYKTDGQGQFFAHFLTAPFIPALIGKNVWSQAAFVANGKFELTRAGWSPVVALPTGSPVAFVKRLYSSGSAAQTTAVGSGPFDTRIPILHLQ